MRYLSLFSGIEAASAAWAHLGWECVAVAEIEKFPCQLLKQKYPLVSNLGDITKITEDDILALGQIDLVVFGSPCQDLSVAGKRKGLDGARSGLFFDAMRIVKWCRDWGGCRWALWENVPGAFSSNRGADFAVVVGQMAGVEQPDIPPKGWGTEGAIVGTEAMVEWSVLDAQWFGVAQRRRRVFAVADFGDWSNRPPILLEPQGMRGNSAPRRETGEGVAGTLASRTAGSGYPGSDEAMSGHVVPVCPTLRAGGNRTGGDRPPGTDVDTVESLIVYSEQRSVLAPAGIPSIAMCLNAGGQGRLDSESQTFVVCATGDVTHTLKADGFDASEDGTGRGTPIIAFNSNAQPDEMRFDPACSASLTCSQNSAVAYSTKLHNTSANGAGKIYEEYTVSLDRSSPPPVLLTQWQVRRLSPIECERLQAFPDNYTLLNSKTADGPRYKALGNSMCVNVMKWIGEQINFVHEWY